ncbi:MAG: protein TolQ [Desulfovibrionaceae bacterium]|nr:protein TolQ [Desulfovibrionaceae bacterium]
MDLSIFGLLNNATLTAKIVLVILLIMSVISWAVMIGKWISVRRGMRRTLKGIERFDASRDLRDAVQSLGADPSSPLYAVGHYGVSEFNRSKESGAAPEVIVDSVRRALSRGVDTEIARVSASLSFLATASNTAPFIGLFGTVWGIMVTFHSIGAMKSASLATVAPGISEALIATAMGLIVAIPATIGYNYFTNAIAALEDELVHFAGMFLNRVQCETNVFTMTSRY